MSLYGYMWCGLIRLGYSTRQSEFNMSVGSISSGLRKSLRTTVKEAKKAIRQGIRNRYTYKGAIPIQAKVGGLTATLTIKGPRQKVSKFRARGGLARYSKGRVTGPKLYVMVVKGQGGTIERGFQMRNRTYWRRDNPNTRLPIHMLYGPSIAQMAGHEPTPVKYIDTVIEKTMSAELEALM